MIESLNLIPADYQTLLFLSGFFVFDLIVFWIYANKNGLSFFRIMLAVFIANSISVIMGMFTPVYSQAWKTVLILFLAFFVATIVEFLVYVPFFYTKNISNIKLFFISLTANLITYAFMLFFALGQSINQVQEAAKDIENLVN